MKNRLSHSAMSRFQICGKSYEYHYVEKIRPIFTTGALVFGSALDAALSALLTNKDNPNAVFEREFTKTTINNTEVSVPLCTDILYANNDFDSDLLIEDDYKILAQEAERKTINRYSNYLEIYKELKDKKTKTGFDSLDNKEKSLYNLMNWLSMRRKGYLMIDAYTRKILPLIEKVHSTQEYVNLENEHGDKVIGYVDMVADIKGYGTVIVDHKTSSMEYDKDAVLTSPQLSLYLHILEEKYKTRKAGYIVMNKSVLKNRKKICKSCGFDGSGSRHKTCSNEVNDKRCNGEWTETIDPDIYIQILVNDIPEQTEKIVLENVDSINEAIKRKEFNRNFNACHNTYGGKCVYFDKCFSNSMKGLCKTGKGEK